jgi:hypothetical protein
MDVSEHPDQQEKVKALFTDLVKLQQKMGDTLQLDSDTYPQTKEMKTL